MHKIIIAIKLLLKGEYRIIAKKILEILIHYKTTNKSITIQNNYNLKPLKDTKKLVVFLVPNTPQITGGVLSIFQLCKISRTVDSEALTLIVTFPRKFTYAKNDNFENDEQVFRFEQIINNIKNINEIILHIPEYYAGRFHTNLSIRQKKILGSIAKVHINILNQNIDLMPESDKLANLYKITNRVTQSSGFLRYSTQQTCDRFNLPLYYVPSFIDLNKCIKKEFTNKKKLILYSPDFHPMKYKILNIIQDNLIGFELKEIKNFTYNQFLEAIASALFCISFGEGFDGYYIQPYYAKSIGITVYNNVFFPKSEIQNFPFVYSNYHSMAENIVDDINKIYQNKKLYETVSENLFHFFENNINKKEDTISGMQRLYSMKPEFIPNLSIKDNSKEKKIEQITNTKDNLKNRIEKKPILTAIIFTYNHRNSIQRCIESLLDQQTNYLYEIHIWDDCSIDGTSEICKKYATKYPDKIVLTVQEENTFLKSYYKLQSYTAIQKINSKYFCSIDGDDYWLDNNKIQIAIDFLELNPRYIGFAHDTLIVDKFAYTNSSYIHDCLKWKVKKEVIFDTKVPFFLVSSRIFRNCGYAERRVLPIDYLQYYYHLSKGPIYYYDKIMAAYVQSKNSTFVSLGSKTRNLNSMFPYRLSLLFNFKEDKFCTDLQKKYDVTNRIGTHRYLILRLLKSILGIEKGWKLWFFLFFVPRYGLKCMDIHYVYCHKKAKKHVDNITINN